MSYRNFLLLIGSAIVFYSCELKSAHTDEGLDSLSIRKQYAKSPVLSATASMELMQLEEGFELQLVAEEPLTVTPVAMSFDKQGRIWVVEMIGYMPDVDGNGEDVPNGNIVILSDTDNDGKMDARKVFLDSLVLPRAISIIEGGVMVAEPPNLWYFENNNDVAGNKTLVDNAYAVGGNVEHQPNGLYRALDNWIYSAKSTKRYRKKGDKWLIEKTKFRGQWGISQNDYGRLFFNSNSSNLNGDYFMPAFGATNKFQKKVSGYYETIVGDKRVFPLRATPGVNRGYREGILDEQLRLSKFTAACGPLIYRGGLFGSQYQGNGFVCEPTANLIKRNIVDHSITEVTGHQAYENKEFLSSKDERFRPVNLYDGPDGNLYVVDMYRGVVQHKTYVTDYLNNEIKTRELEQPLNCGRIYRVVRKDARPNTAEFSDDPKELVKLLGHNNGWVRDKAQQLIVDGGYLQLESTLRENLKNTEDRIKLIHSLWTLEGLGLLDWEDAKSLLLVDDIEIKNQVLAVLPALVTKNNYLEARASILEILSNDKLITQAVYAISSYIKLDREVALNDLINIIKKHPSNRFVVDAVINNFSGSEVALMDELTNWNPDSTLLIKKSIEDIFANIEEDRQDKLNKELLTSLSHGKELYSTICQTCHGDRGKGVRSLAPRLSKSEWVLESKDRLIAVVLFGLHGPIEVRGEKYSTPEVLPEMPGLINNKELSDDDIAQILSFIRNSWGNRGDLVDEKDIQRVRDQYPDRKTAFSAEELSM